jgi:hypothetical protein
MFKVLVSNEEARQTIAAQLDDIATLVKVSTPGTTHTLYRWIDCICVYS